MSLKFHTNCYSFNSFNHLGTLDGHYTILLERYNLSTFAFYKMGGYGTFTWFPKVDFQIRDINKAEVERMREVIHIKLARESVFESPFIPQTIECKQLAGYENKTIHKYWGLLPKFETNLTTEYQIQESVGVYLTFENSDGRELTRATYFDSEVGKLRPEGKHFTEKPKTPFQHYRQTIKVAKEQGLVFKGRGDFDMWLKTSFNK
jgi:hypothetical protein